MASIEEVRQALKKAEGELAEAKTALQKFETGKGGKSLEQLRDKLLNGEVLTPAVQQVVDDLVVKEKQLEESKTYWEKQVGELQLRLTATQAGQKRSYEEMEEIINTAVKKALHEHERSVISISRASRKDYQRLIDFLGLERKTINFTMKKAPRVKPFKWTQKSERGHANDYIEWLQNNIVLPEDCEYYDASAIPSLLNTTIDALPFNITGTVDVAIVDKKNVKSGNVAGGLRIGIEVKKSVEASTHSIQAVMELVTANIYSEYPVTIVLTDLAKHWQFFWLEKGMIVDCTFSISEAKTLLEAMVVELGTSATTTVAAASRPNSPFTKRCNLKAAIGGGDAEPSSSEIQGIERALNRPKIDPLDLLPEDDVASMRDVFDVMDDNEVREWKCRKVLAYMKQTPALQSSLNMICS